MKLSYLQKFNLVFYCLIILIFIWLASGFVSFIQEMNECENSGGYLVKKLPYGHFCQKVNK